MIKTLIVSIFLLVILLIFQLSRKKKTEPTKGDITVYDCIPEPGDKGYDSFIGPYNQFVPAMKEISSAFSVPTIIRPETNTNYNERVPTTYTNYYNKLTSLPTCREWCEKNGTATWNPAEGKCSCNPGSSNPIIENNGVKCSGGGQGCPPGQIYIPEIYQCMVFTGYELVSDKIEGKKFFGSPVNNSYGNPQYTSSLGFCKKSGSNQINNANQKLGILVGYDKVLKKNIIFQVAIYLAFKESKYYPTYYEILITAYYEGEFISIINSTSATVDSFKVYVYPDNFIYGTGYKSLPHVRISKSGTSEPGADPLFFCATRDDCSTIVNTDGSWDTPYYQNIDLNWKLDDPKAGTYVRLKNGEYRFLPHFASSYDANFRYMPPAPGLAGNIPELKARCDKQKSDCDGFDTDGTFKFFGGYGNFEYQPEIPSAGLYKKAFRPVKIDNCGADDMPRGWYDFSQVGQRNDFCRYIKEGETERFSCYIAGTRNQTTPKQDVYDPTAPHDVYGSDRYVVPSCPTTITSSDQIPDSYILSAFPAYEPVIVKPIFVKGGCFYFLRGAPGEFIMYVSYQSPEDVQELNKQKLLLVSGGKIYEFTVKSVNIEGGRASITASIPDTKITKSTYDQYGCYSNIFVLTPNKISDETTKKSFASNYTLNSQPFVKFEEIKRLTPQSIIAQQSAPKASNGSIICFIKNGEGVATVLKSAKQNPDGLIEYICDDAVNTYNFGTISECANGPCRSGVFVATPVEKERVYTDYNIGNDFISGGANFVTATNPENCNTLCKNKPECIGFAYKPGGEMNCTLYSGSFKDGLCKLPSYGDTFSLKKSKDLFTCPSCPTEKIGYYQNSDINMQQLEGKGPNDNKCTTNESPCTGNYPKKFQGICLGSTVDPKNPPQCLPSSRICFPMNLSNPTAGGYWRNVSSFYK